MGKRAVGIGLVVLVCTALAACGDDGGGTRLTAAELTAKGDAVCTKLDDDVKALATTLPVSITFTPDQMKEFYTKLVPLLDQAVTGFKALAPPEDLETAFDSALEQIEIDRRTLVGATSSPEAARNLYDTQVDPFTATNQKLAAAGITACGGTPATDDGPSGTTPTTAAGTETTGTPSTTAAVTTTTGE